MNDLQKAKAGVASKIHDEIKTKIFLLKANIPFGRDKCEFAIAQLEDILIACESIIEDSKSLI